MVSPDTLIRIGSFFGQTGVSGFILIILTAFFYTIALPNISQQITRPLQPLDNFIIFFYSCVKYIAVIFIATGLLVTCGFVFNEVFLYWFPNFGFAFILLGLLIALQFLPRKFIYYAQLLFVLIPTLGLMVFIITGFTQDQSQNISLSIENIFSLPHFETNTLFLTLLLFIGFDLGLTIPNRSDKNQFLQNKIITISIFAMSLLFILWGYLFLNFIPIKKLLDTTIPHMILARNILRNPGRWLMGAMVISGSLGAIHAIFSNLSLSYHDFISFRIYPQKKLEWGKIKIISAGIIISALMAGGMAGDEKLEVFTKSALILWLISYALLSLSNLFINKIADNNKNFVTNIKSGLITLILFVSILMLIITDPNITLILKFLAVSVLVILFFWNLYRFKDSIRKYLTI